MLGTVINFRTLSFIKTSLDLIDTSALFLHLCCSFLNLDCVVSHYVEILTTVGILGLSGRCESQLI